MNGYEAFQIYQAVRLHFTSDKFDFFLYHGKSRTSQASFETRKDKYSFHKLARMYSEKELPFFLASNFSEKQNVWIRDLILDEAKERYLQWTKRQQSRMYFFKEDLCKLEEHDFGKIIQSVNGQNPELLDLVFQKEISEETFLILDSLLNLLDAWSNKIEDDFIWKGFEKRMRKYKPFFFSYAPVSLPHFKKELLKVLTISKE